MNEKDRKTYELVTDWLCEYKSTSDVQIKSRLKTLIVTSMLPIVKRIAHTIARRSYDPIEDLVQAGALGLIKAINTFSPEINDNFQIHAGYKIIGEMKHYLRDKMNMVRVPRYIQELVFRINSFTSTLTPDELKNLTNDEVAEVLNVPREKIDYAIEFDRRKYTLSFEELFDNEKYKTLGYEELIVDKEYSEKEELNDIKIILNDAINALPDEYKTIVEMYYYQDMNQKTIASELNISEMQVSRKIKKAYSILYDFIQNRAEEN